MTEPSIIICAYGPITKDSVPGTEIRACAWCDRDITLAPSGQEIVDQDPENTVLLCLECGRQAIEADPAPKLMPMTPAQRDELLDYFGKPV